MASGNGEGVKLNTKVLWGLTFLAAAAVAYLYLVSWHLALNAPLSLEYEGPCLSACMELARGHNVYDAERLTSRPWEVIIYTPLYFCFGALFQFNGPSYWGLRLVSMLSLCATLFFSYRLFRASKLERLSVGIAVIALASFLPMWSWSWKGRVDMFSLALSVAALDFFVRAFQKRLAEPASTEAMFAPKELFKLVLLYLPATIFSTAALYTKQPSLFIAIVLVLFLLYRRKFADAIAFAGATGILIALVFVVLQLVTDGGFLAHMVFTSKMRFSWEFLVKHLLWFGADWLKIVSAPVLLAVWFFRKGDKSEVILPVILCIITGVFTLYSLGTIYATVNHAFITLIGLVWLIAIALDRMPVIGAALVFPSILVSGCVMQQLNGRLAETVAQMPNTIERLKQLNLQGQTLFVEDPALAFVTSSTPLFVDVATFLQVWSRQNRPLTELTSALNKKEFAAVIINEKDSDGETPRYFWTDEVRDAILRNYKRTEGKVIGNGETQILFLPNKNQRVSSHWQVHAHE